MMITLGLVCMVLTAVIFIQFNTIKQTDLDSIDTMREDELRSEIVALKTKYDETIKKAAETDIIIAEYEEKINSGKEASELLAKELMQSQDLLGISNVQGPRNNYNTCRYRRSKNNTK